MSRVTAPISKQLGRALSAGAHTSARPATGALLEHNAGAILMPKYADLLRTEHTDSSRGLTTAHRPTPQPSLTNRSKPLMQTFTQSASTSTTASSKSTDATVLPSYEALYSPTTTFDLPRMPITPDNYSGYAAETTETSVPEITIVAADPEKVMPATILSEVDTVGLDGVELKFVHESSSSNASADKDAHQGGMLRDLWKGMIDDVFGEPAKKAI